MVTQVMSDLETLVYNFLVKRGVGFQFQTSFSGGWYELGGAVVDFLVEPNLAWRVMGEYYHQGVSKSGSDVIQREMLEAEGFVVVDIWGLDIQNRLNETMRLALIGREML